MVISRPQRDAGLRGQSRRQCSRRSSRPTAGAGSAPATRACIDEEGYLRITGRLKEIINRGGEKVSPLEVDEVLMDHPAIAQVVTFAMPHAKLGEEVAAAVVLREGMVVDEQEIRAFAAGRLADFKVPRKVVILAEIPKGATGKLQRIGLAQKLGLGEMRICIYGAGAIGGLLGAKLARAGADVSADRARAASGGHARAAA